MFMIRTQVYFRPPRVARVLHVARRTTPLYQVVSARLLPLGHRTVQVMHTTATQLKRIKTCGDCPR
jgi:hypothetical protein